MSSAREVRGLASSPTLVLAVYGLVVLPLGLYVYHDVLDSRWRRVQNLHLSCVTYITLYILSGACMIAYFTIQILGQDFKEAGSAFVVLVLGGYGFRKFLRLYRILHAHRDLVQGPVREADEVLTHLLPNECGQALVDNFQIRFWVQPLRQTTCSLREGLKLTDVSVHPSRNPSPTVLQPRAEEQFTDDSEFSDDDAEPDLPEPRAHFLCSSLFDDDFPGDQTARIKWLRWDQNPVVVKDDAFDCAMRIALFMRLALRPAQNELWTAITPTHKLVSLSPGYLSLGKVLRRLISSGSEQNAVGRGNANPVEDLLRQDRDVTLEQIGVAFFWIANSQSAEELSQALSIFPQPWLRDAQQSAAQLVFEICVLLILASRLKPPVNSNRSLCCCLNLFRVADSLGIDASDHGCALPLAVTPSWIETSHAFCECSWDATFYDESKRMQLAAMCADAVASFLENNRSIMEVGSTAQLADYSVMLTKCTDIFYVAMGRFCEKGVLSDFPDVTGSFVGCAIQEVLIACRHSGCVVEAAIGPKLAEKITSRYGTHATVAKAEVVFGLAAIAAHLRLAEDRVQLLMNKWWQDWGYGLEAPRQSMIEVAKERILREENSRLRPKKSGAEWLVTPENERCPNHLEAFIGYTRMAKYLAESVFVAFEGWSLATDEGQRQNIVFTSAGLGNPRRLQRTWLKWKRNQGKKTRGSTFT
jgi:hypothetical protein